MPKIIFTSRYLRNAPPAQLKNYVRYVGTREGVEKIDKSKLQLPATANQRHLIRQLIRDIPTGKTMLEYADFLLRPTIGNASEFISCALEQNLDLVAKRENYVDYIAHRPRVERVGEHGLFTDAGTPVVLGRVQNQVANHKGPVWTHVISLRREDAARLGYDSAEQWMALIRSKRAMLCKHMKISSENLRWYAAFHNEGNHPHVHLMVYSAKDNDGFLTEKSIEAMRSELAHDIFRQDFAHTYEQQNQARSDLKTGAADVLRELMDALQSGTLANPQIAEQMELLAVRLQNTNGKKVYGYLKRDVKNIIDQIVDELAKDSRVAALYQAWGKWNDEILLTCRSTAPPLPPLSQQPQFKSIKNMVIAEAMSLGGHRFTFEDEQVSEPVLPDEFPQSVTEDPTEPPEPEEGNTAPPNWQPESRRTSGGSGRNSMWSARYKNARKFLFGDQDTTPDFEKADKLQYRLGQMLHSGTGTEKDDAAAAAYWERSAKLGNVNAQYALGKLWLESGTGDPEQAVAWIAKAADAGNAAAQYALGKLYLCGHEVPRDKEKAVPFLQASAAQGNIYAQFLLDHIDSFCDPAPFLAATRLLHRLENLFREDTRRAVGGEAYHIDRKRRRRLSEKKQAQGHKEGDQEPLRQRTH